MKAHRFWSLVNNYLIALYVTARAGVDIAFIIVFRPYVHSTVRNYFISTGNQQGVDDTWTIDGMLMLVGAMLVLRCFMPAPPPDPKAPMKKEENFKMGVMHDVHSGSIRPAGRTCIYCKNNNFEGPEVCWCHYCLAERQQCKRNADSWIVERGLVSPSSAIGLAGLALWGLRIFAAVRAWQWWRMFQELNLEGMADTIWTGRAFAIWLVVVMAVDFSVELVSYIVHCLVVCSRRREEAERDLEKLNRDLDARVNAFRAWVHSPRPAPATQTPAPASISTASLDRIMPLTATPATASAATPALPPNGET